MNRSLIAVLFTILFLAGCGRSEEIPSYSLPSDLSWRTYQGNEQATYSIDGQYNDVDVAPRDIDGEMYLNWQPSTADTRAIDALKDIPLLVEQWKSNIPNIPEFYLQRHFWQKPDGQLVYAGFTLQNNGQTFWATPTGTTTPSAGIETLDSPQPEAPAPMNYDLWLCDASSCLEKVATVNESYTYRGIETVKTPYALFETLRYQFSLSITGTVNYSDLRLNLRGHNWVYPPLGPVKFSWLISDNVNTSFTNISVALLVATNVSLPPAD